MASRAAAAPARTTRPRKTAEPARVRRSPAKPAQRPAARPAPRSRAKAKRASSRGAIALIALGGILLAGVVFVNLAVLRLNLRLDSATQARSKLRAENATLQSQLSAALASHRIQSLAHEQDGLVQADPSTIGYIDLGKK